MLKKIRTSAKIFFKQKSGSASIVRAKNGFYYFVPAKKDIRLEGESLPIAFKETFTFVNSDLISYNNEDKTRLVKISLCRDYNETMFYLTESQLRKYFGY